MSYSIFCVVRLTISLCWQLAEQDQDLYRNFTMTISERWQQEVAETVFEAINQDTDKLEQKRKQKPRIDDVDLGNSLRNYKQTL